MPRVSAKPAQVAESRLNALLDAAVDAMILIDPKGRITRFNPSAERLFGYAEDEVFGRNVSMLMPEPYRSEHDGYLGRYAGTGERRIIGIGREVTAQRKDGSTFPIDLSVGEFRTTEEHGFVGILRDLTERKAQTREAEELRARLTHAGRLGTLGEMVSGIAHEVNQPLTAIANFASACRRFAQSGRLQGPELIGALEQISTQADRAGQVIRGLRAMLRRRDEVREPVDCNRLIREVVKLVDFEVRQAGFWLDLQLAPALPAVAADGIQIQQVVLNLVRNALDAMLDRAADDAITVTSAETDGFVEIRVADSGPGLSPDAAAHVFQPFFTTKPHGIGLGLSICQSIVRAHGGELTVGSRVTGGAEFQVRLPAEKPS